MITPRIPWRLPPMSSRWMIFRACFGVDGGPGVLGSRGLSGSMV